jgi:hypothetical protein
MKTLTTLLAMALAAVGLACSSPLPNRNPVGETFPRVTGESLDGREHELPGEFAGKKVLLLVGYVQKTQFDIDRWLLGLMQAEVSVAVREVPTIKGFVPGLISGVIDGGMRRGIPEEDWGAVITVYGDAGEIVALTGNENPNNARVLLLDETGKVVWFHDRGYSPRLAMEIARLCGGAGM